MCHVFPYTIKTAVTQRNENGRNVKVLEKTQRFKTFLWRQSTYWFPLTCSLNVRKGPMKRTLQNPLKHLEQIQSGTILTWRAILPRSSAEEGFENTTQWIFNQLNGFWWNEVLWYHKQRTEISNWIFATNRDFIPGLSRIGTGVMFLFPLASDSTHLAKYIYRIQVSLGSQNL